MKDHPYTHLDLVWLAQDQRGFVGAFVTGGAGPIPESALAYAKDDPSLEHQLTGLPESCQATLHFNDGDMSSYVALAKRGLAVYDWRDVHRTVRDCSNAYELVCSPAVPSKSESLPARLRAAAQATTLDVSSLEANPSVVVPHGA